MTESDPFAEDHLHRVVKSVCDDLEDLNERLDTPSDAALIERELGQLVSAQITLNKIIQRLAPPRLRLVK